MDIVLAIAGIKANFEAYEKRLRDIKQSLFKIEDENKRLEDQLSKLKIASIKEQIPRIPQLESLPTPAKAYYAPQETIRETDESLEDSLQNEDLNHSSSRDSDKDYLYQKFIIPDKKENQKKMKKTEKEDQPKIIEKPKKREIVRSRGEENDTSVHQTPSHNEKPKSKNPPPPPLPIPRPNEKPLSPLPPHGPGGSFAVPLLVKYQGNSSEFSSRDSSLSSMREPSVLLIPKSSILRQPPPPLEGGVEPSPLLSSSSSFASLSSHSKVAPSFDFARSTRGSDPFAVTFYRGATEVHSNDPVQESIRRINSKISNEIKM